MKFSINFNKHSPSDVSITLKPNVTKVAINSKVITSSQELYIYIYSNEEKEKKMDKT